MAAKIIVNLAEGSICGKQVHATSFSKRKYNAFQGIPYAEPPVGNLRFRDPQPIARWEGIRDTLGEAPTCPQHHSVLSKVMGDEDNCLALNVYTPHLPDSGVPLMPVMVWFYGGGFTFGNGNTDIHDPDYWMEKDVVIVTGNYRVGAFGFLSLENSEVPGNAGLKDQVIILRWIQRNISQFNGDPGSVTLFGGSAGGASCHYHILSPMSRGLFHRAIMISGSSLNCWAFSPNPVVRSFRLGELLGHKTSDPQDLLQFLESVPASDILKVQLNALTPEMRRNSDLFPFVPCVEPKEGGGERFLTDHPRILLQRGEMAPVPIIIGVNEKEGMMSLMADKPRSEDYIKELGRNFSGYIPKHLGLPFNASDKIRRFFFGEKSVDFDTINEYIDFFGDLWFYIGIDETIRLHLERDVAPVYSYRLSFDGELVYLSFFLRQMYPHCSLKGVSHADETGYLFKMNEAGLPQLSPGTPEERFISQITGMWLQFAKTGNPNLEDQKVLWEPARLDNSAWRGFLELNEPLEMKDSRIEQRRMVFWDSLLRPMKRN